MMSRSNVRYAEIEKPKMTYRTGVSHVGTGLVLILTPMPERSESGNRGGTLVRFVRLFEESHAQLGNWQRVTASFTVVFIVNLSGHI